MWDPKSYLRYGDERSRPFHDLLARVAAQRPRAVVDLGCGPGNLTGGLAARWPGARVTGIDSSPEMIRSATGTTSGAESRITFVVGDVRDWAPGPDDDVVVSNAALQWVPDHDELLVRWVGRMPAGGWLAVQVPGNFDAPSHRALRAVAADSRWRDRLGQLSRDLPVSDAVGYATLLTRAGCAVDAWETTFVHQLPADDEVDHPVLTWMDGTALRPVRAAFAAPASRPGPAGGNGAAGRPPVENGVTAGEAEARVDPCAWPLFRTELAERLAEAYPVESGVVNFPFRRVFLVARTPG